jgi:gliding motility-associated-like protein
MGTYLWSTGATTSITTISSPGVYTATVSSGSCGTATTSVSVGALPSPTISISAPSSSVCAGSSIILTANSSTGNYLWSNGATTQTVSVSSPSVMVTTTNTCGSVSATQILTIVPLPTVTVTPQSSMLCPGYTGTLTATSNAGNFLWSTGAVSTNTILTPAPGLYWVTVSNVCGTKTASATVGSVTMSPIVIIASSYSICPNETATLTATGGILSGFGPSTYLWSNSTATGSVNTTTGGVVSLSVTNTCGVYTQSINVSVNPLTADITANPVSGISPLIVSFADNSVNANTYLWDFGNGSVANTQTVSSQTYNSTGTYIAYLTVTNGVCMDVDSLIITVLEEGPTLYVPNAFTPNGDSINDVFRVSATGIKEFNMMIFDRWGLKMFETNDILKGWDGKVNGNIVADGTYYHLIKAKGIDGVEIKKQGTVTLFK